MSKVFELLAILEDEHGKLSVPDNHHYSREELKDFYNKITVHHRVNNIPLIDDVVPLKHTDKYYGILFNPSYTSSQLSDAHIHDHKVYDQLKKKFGIRIIGARPPRTPGVPSTIVPNHRTF